MSRGPEFLRLSIEFDRSHLFFPYIVTGILLALLVLIAALRGPAFIARLRAGGVGMLLPAPGFDHVRFFGSLGLIVVYFVAMDFFSDFAPNTGLSFLFTSIVFMAALSLLYVHGPTRRKLTLIAACSVGLPLVAWYAFTTFFNLTLP
ncbi:tripartite tricarboxylate transporter TctB family protein [Oleispirillum naphthae]|uniref:tripartite tricarboxylate transporter TctB family protein n=1 Tax=Oleispirillum naphthae TaxID=2838853 RepID=UPI0030822B5A